MPPSVVSRHKARLMNYPVQKSASVKRLGIGESRCRMQKVDPTHMEIDQQVNKGIPFA
jgi:hypothetical protein